MPGVLGDLQRAGYLLAAGKKRRLNATRRLLDEWALAYARRLRPKTLDATYTTPNLDTWRQWKIDPREVRWGGEPAANLMVGHLTPGVLTLYAEKLPAKLIVAQRMVTADRRAPDSPTVELRHPFWGQTLAMPEEPVTPAPLVYADLLATGDAHRDRGNALCRKAHSTFPSGLSSRCTRKRSPLYRKPQIHSGSTR